MSTSDSSPIVLSGDFIEVCEVTDVGTSSETETVVGATMGEIAFERDSETVEANLHEQALTIRDRTHYALDTSFTATTTPGLSALETVGVVDSNGDPTSGAQWECARYKIYDGEPGSSDATVQAVLETYNVDLQFEDVTLGVGDPGEINITAFVSGGWHLGSTSPA